MVKIERYASGKWDVQTVGDYPRRIGHITGGNRNYLAEMGPDGTLGYFPTLKAAAEMIETRAKSIAYEAEVMKGLNTKHRRGF